MITNFDNCMPPSGQNDSQPTQGVFQTNFVGLTQNVLWLFMKPKGLNRYIFGDTQEPHPRTSRHPEVKMSKQIAVKFPELIHAAKGYNPF